MYKTNDDLPDNIKNVLPTDAQTVWRTVFNENFDKGEDSARKIAWTAVKNGWEKGENEKWTKKSASFEFSGDFISAGKEKHTRSWEVIVLSSEAHPKNAFAFSRECLRGAVELFDNVPVTIRSDFEHKNVPVDNYRDIVGIISNPVFKDDGSKAEIRASLRFLPSYNHIHLDLVDLFSNGNIGSGDWKDVVSLSFSGYGLSTVIDSGIELVNSLTKVNSVDLVLVPATNTSFVRLAASFTKKEGHGVTREVKLKFISKYLSASLVGIDMDKISDDDVEKLYSDAVTASLEVKENVKEDEKQEEQKKESAQVIEFNSIAKRLNVSDNRQVLRSLCASLPNQLKDTFSKRYEKHLEVDPKDFYKMVSAAVDDAIAIIDTSVQLAGGLSVEYLRGRDDKLRTALDGFFLNKDIDGIPKFKSFKAAFTAFTGSHDYSEAIHLPHGNLRKVGASLTTDSWAEALGDSIRRAMIADYLLPTLDAWKKITLINSAPDFRINRRIRIGGYGNLPVVNQGAPYNAVSSPTDEEATYAVQKRGGTEDLTLEMIMNDDIGAIRRIPINLSRAAKQTLHEHVFDFIKDNSTCTYDSVAMFNAAHGNLETAALAQTTLTTNRLKLREQTMLGSGKQLGLMMKYIIVPPELEEIAYKLAVSPTMIGATNNAATEPNIHGASNLEVIVVNYWTDANNWYSACDQADCPIFEIGFLNGKEEPELFVQDMQNVGSMFDRDKVTYKIRHIYQACILDHRGMVANIVA